MSTNIITILIILGLIILLIWIILIISSRYFNKRMKDKSSKGVPNYRGSNFGGNFGGD